MFHGVPYDAMADDPTTELDEAHMFEPHYDRHVWIYRENRTACSRRSIPPFRVPVIRGTATQTSAHGSH